MITPKNRVNGRLANQLRDFAVDLDPMGFSLASLTVHTGLTSVLCSVSIADSVPGWLEGKGRGWLSAEYRLLPGSTPTRQKRELIKLSGRTQEIQRLIARSLRAVIDFHVLGERTLLIDCDVIQADAGTRTASITGAWIALKIACSRLIDQGLLSQDPVTSQVAAVSVGLVDGNELLDLDYSEDSKADVDLNVVMDEQGRFLELQGTAEGAPFTKEKLQNLLSFAEEGISDLQSAQLSVLQKQG